MRCSDRTFKRYFSIWWRFSARDDGYGTYASSQYTASKIAGAKFLGFEQGGHMWIVHNDEMQREILKWLTSSAKL